MMNTIELGLLNKEIELNYDNAPNSDDMLKLLGAVERRLEALKENLPNDETLLDLAFLLELAVTNLGIATEDLLLDLEEKNNNNIIINEGEM